MGRKNTTTSLLKECIVQSMLMLLEEHDIESVSVKDIAERAGVNRSTYYRHFKDKYEVAECFYSMRLDEYLDSVRGSNIGVLEYFTGMFEHFAQYKNQLLLLNRRGLSPMLLRCMNNRFNAVKVNSDMLYIAYHLGGVFNSFLLWMNEEMATSPAKLAECCVAILPEDFIPLFLKVKDTELIK